MLHYAFVFALINRGGSTCRLSGYPRLIPEDYSFRIPLRIHEDMMWPYYRSPKWGHPVTGVALPPGGRADFGVGWVGNPDASAARLRYCSRVAGTTFKLVLPHVGGPIGGALIGVGFCPTKDLGSYLYVSPILAAPLSS
jgi:hypothetical protein